MDFLKKIFGIEDKPRVDLAAVVKQGALLVDVRSPMEFKSGSVPKAINIPVETLVQQLDKLKGHENIIVFCRSGNRSSAAQGILKAKGFNNVIDGGTWQNVNSFVVK